MLHSQILQPPRMVDVSFKMQIPECALTDEQLEQHLQGIGNVLFMLLSAGMSTAPLPHQPATYVVAKVSKPVDQQ